MGDNPAMNWNFTKMHGAGNDFVVLDGVRQTIEMTPERARALGDRHFGIGADQILLVERATRPDADFRYRIFNADGLEVEQCGNGARCFVRFVREHGLTDKRRIRVETASGIIVPELQNDDEVRVDMGVPRFAPADIPFVADADSVVHAVRVGDDDVDISVVSMGNPHAVQVVSSVDDAPVTTQGPLLERHVRFPARVNAGYMQVLDRATIRLRVWERGAGETLSCGTGACAAAVIAIRRGLADSRLCVHTRGGVLAIEWSGPSHPVFMTGPAVTVFEGTWSPPDASQDSPSPQDLAAGWTRTTLPST